MDDEFLSTSEAAEFLKISQSTLQKLLKRSPEERPPSYKPKFLRNRLFLKSELIVWMQKYKEE